MALRTLQGRWRQQISRDGPDASLPSKKASEAVYRLLAATDPTPLEGYLTEVYKQSLGSLNDRAAELARQQAGELVTGLKKADQKALGRIMQQALDLGWTDAQIERRVAQVVGLGPRYAQAVENYRDGLAQRVPPAQVAKLTRQYATRLRAYRASMIAKTEIQKALNEAQREIWREKQAMGEISRYAVRVFRVHKDERLCPVCRPNNGRRASLRKTTPFDPPLHPNCRCYEELSDEKVNKSALGESFEFRHLVSKHR